MSEKRFKFTEFAIIDTEEEKKYLCDSEDMMKLVDLLNELAEENEQLHHLKVLANAFIVEKRLEVEFVRWCKEDE